MQILIINGPNLHIIGDRETDIYGKDKFDVFFNKLKDAFNDLEISYFQSNSESDIVKKIHECEQTSIKGVILNAGAYSHSSLAIRDAISAVDIPVVNLHISNVYKREKFRNNNFIAAVCSGVITGFGIKSYQLALVAIKDILLWKEKEEQ